MVDGTNKITHARTHGCLHLIDLAGSERVSRSGAEGQQLLEAQHINKSLRWGGWGAGMGVSPSAVSRHPGHALACTLRLSPHHTLLLPCCTSPLPRPAARWAT